MINLGVIGFGKRINDFVNNSLRQVDPNIKLAGIVDNDQFSVCNRLKTAGVEIPVFYANLEKMMSSGKIDALLIGTNCDTHAQFAIEAAKYKVPLFLEKPVAINLKQAAALENAYEKSANQVVVSFPLRVSPLCSVVKKHIDSGAIGTPEHILGQSYVTYGLVYFEESYRNYDRTQGLFVQKATHDLDYMSYLMGANIVRVSAMHTRGNVYGGREAAGLRCSECETSSTCLESPKNRKLNSSSDHLDDHLCTFSVECGSPELGMNEDSSSVLLEFSSGRHGVYTQVFFSRRDAKKRGAIISGYHGTLSFDWDWKELKYVSHHSPYTNLIKEDLIVGQQHFGGDIKLAQNFINVIHGKEKSNTPIWLGIQSIYACLAAKLSAEKGEFVKVRQVGQVA